MAASSDRLATRGAGVPLATSKSDANGRGSFQPSLSDLSRFFDECAGRADGTPVA
jgi:hypothetical protein